MGDQTHALGGGGQVVRTWRLGAWGQVAHVRDAAMMVPSADNHTAPRSNGVVAQSGSKFTSPRHNALGQDAPWLPQVVCPGRGEGGRLLKEKQRAGCVFFLFFSFSRFFGGGS